MREINGTVENVCVPWLTHYCLGYSYIYIHIYIKLRNDLKFSPCTSVLIKLKFS